MAASTLAGMIADWVTRRRAQATGAAPAPVAPDDGAARVETVGPEPAAAPAAAPAPDLPEKPYANPKNLLERQYNQLWEIEQQLAKAKLDAQSGDDAVRIPAEKILPTLTTQQTSLLSQIGQQENREADNRRADETRAQTEADRKQREEEAKSERERKAAQEPREGDSRTQRVQHNGVWATITERYSRGQWSYVSGSAKPETGLLGERSEADALDLQRKQVDVDRARTAYENETDPVAKETRRVALEAARVALQQAQQTLNKPTESTQDGYLVRVAPGGELSRVDLLTPEQRRQKDEDDARKRETEARGTLPTNAYAALQQETQRLQGRAQDKLAELQARQQRGELSAEQASNQFQTWFQGNVKAPLEGLRASAEEAQRAERAQVEERNRLEDIRVQQANQQREQAGYQAGESARSALIGTFPSARSPEFAQAYGANVAAMSQRAQGRTAEERMAAPRSPGYTPQALDAARIQAVMPSPDAIAAAARQRALAAIAPTVAVRAGFTAPALPSAPDIQGLLGSLPYRGPLSGPPLPSTGLLPTEGRGAVDLGNGLARTYYGPNGEVYGPDWRITP